MLLLPALYNAGLCNTYNYVLLLLSGRAGGSTLCDRQGPDRYDLKDGVEATKETAEERHRCYKIPPVHTII